MSTAKTNRILLVEDDDLLRRGLERFLTLSGYQVTAVADSLSCYREIDGKTFDVALIDLGLPDQRGETLIAYLRHNTTSAIAVITAHDDLDTRVACYRSGADLFLSKPVDGQELVAAIDSLAGRVRLLHEVASPPAPDSVPARWVLQTRSRTLISPDEQRLRLTAKEWNLFSTIATHPDHTSRQTLLTVLYRRDDPSAQQALDTLLRRTRQKIVKKLGIPDPIINEYGVGYRIGGSIYFEDL